MAVPAPVAVLPRRWTVATLALSAAALSLAHAGLWSLLVSVALVTLVLVPEARRRRRFLVDVAAWLPVGAMVLLAGVIVVVVILGFAGVQLWSPDVAPFTWATSVLLVGAVGFWRGGHVALVPLLGRGVAEQQVLHGSLPCRWWRVAVDGQLTRVIVDEYPP